MILEPRLGNGPHLLSQNHRITLQAAFGRAKEYVTWIKAPALAVGSAWDYYYDLHMCVDGITAHDDDGTPACVL
jgi:hypothetical protein